MGRSPGLLNGNTGLAIAIRTSILLVVAVVSYQVGSSHSPVSKTAFLHTKAAHLHKENKESRKEKRHAEGRKQHKVVQGVDDLAYIWPPFMDSNEERAHVLRVRQALGNHCTRPLVELPTPEKLGLNHIRFDDYSEYESMVVDLSSNVDYKALKRLGSGHYGTAFRGVHKATKQVVVLKRLKPNEEQMNKLRREIKVLMNVCGGPNIMKLIDAIEGDDSENADPTLVLEYVNMPESRTFYQAMSEHDVQHYAYQILKGLAFAHSMGIMHRDIKPGNVAIDPEKRIVRIVDWGLATFYERGLEYNVRVGTRMYKTPELLVNLRQYDYRVDIYAFGVMLLEIVLGTGDKKYFFYGSDNNDQLIKIAQVMGTDGMFAWLDRYDIELDSYYDGRLSRRKHRYPKKELSSFIDDSNWHRATADALDLLEKMLAWDFEERPSALECMMHPFFATIREKEKDQEMWRNPLEEQDQMHAHNPLSFMK